MNTNYVDNHDVQGRVYQNIDNFMTPILKLDASDLTVILRQYKMSVHVAINHLCFVIYDAM